MKDAPVESFEAGLARHSAKPLAAVSRLAINADYREDANSKLKYDALLSAKHATVEEDPGPIGNKLYRSRKAGGTSALPPLQQTPASFDRFSCSKNVTSEQINTFQRSRGVATNTKRDKEMNKNGISRPKSAFPRQSRSSYVTCSEKPLIKGLDQKATRDTGKINSRHRSNLSQRTEITIVVDEHKDRMVAENCVQLGSIGCTEKCLRWLQGL